MLIRQYTQSDAPQIKRVVRSALESVFGKGSQDALSWPDIDTISITYLVKGGNFWVATEDTKILGCIGVLPGSETGQLVIKRFMVDPRVQGKGVGKNLLEHVLQWAKNNKSKLVTLTTYPQMYRAIQLYERFGFKQVPLNPPRENSNQIQFERIIA